MERSIKQYLKDENGVMRLGKPISILTGPYNQDGTKEIETIFGKKVFNNPKPKELIKYLLSFVFDGKDDKDGIYLDSFVIDRVYQIRAIIFASCCKRLRDEATTHLKLIVLHFVFLDFFLGQRCSNTKQR